MASEMPKVKFENGYECPILGIGTWKVLEKHVINITYQSHI